MPRQASSTIGLPIIPGQRPAPPDQLGADATAIWERITAGLPLERITDVGFAILGPLLCEHIANAEFLAAAIDRLLDEKALTNPDKREVLFSHMRAHREQTQAAGTLATKLRLTPQSRYLPDKHALGREKVSAHPPPWEDWGTRTSS